MLWQNRPPYRAIEGRCFRCKDDRWIINRAKDATTYATSAYRRESRLEIILDYKTSGWEELESKLLQCLCRPDGRATTRA